jgi:D-3-phosphoglycerate dehydrogenase
MYKVLLTDHPDSSALEAFSAYPEIEAVSVGTLPPADLAAMLSEYDAVIVRSPTRLTEELIAAGKKLRFIGRAGVGVDNVDVEAARRRGIVVLYVPDANTVSTAEHTVGMIVSVARRIAEADASLRAGRWERNRLDGVELYGKTLGIVGLGRVGREVARRMLAFSMRVIASDPYAAEDAARGIGVELVDLDSLLRRSDVISLHVALTRETAGLISRREVEKMRRGVLVVNCSRGEIVDEAALGEALASGRIGGLGLDVFSQEPPGSHPLFAHPRTVFTPHLGSATREARARVGAHIAESVAKALVSGEIRDAFEPRPR